MVSFYDIVQAYFTQMTGRFVMFSGRDMALLQRWRSQGATPASVCRGIREAVLHMTKEPPRSIYNCRKFIEPHVERARQLLLEQEGGADAAQPLPELGLKTQVAQVSAGQVSAKAAPLPGAPQAAAQRLSVRLSVLRGALSVLEQAGRRCEDEAVRALYREMWYRVRALDMQGASVMSVEAQYEQLLRLEEELAEGYYAALSLAEQRQIDDRLSAEEAEQPLGLRMSPEAWSRHRAARKNRVLMRHYGMVSLLD